MEKNLANALTIGVVLIGFVLIISILPNADNTSEDTNLKKFRSYDELKSFIKDSSEKSQGSQGFFGGAESIRTTASDAVVSGQAAAPQGESASQYSQTNIQVEGVDELDFVKNDGKYIYTVSGNKVIIVESFPAEAMKKLSEIELNEQINGLFVNDDKLIVVASKYSYYYGYERGDAVTTDEFARAIIAPTAPQEQVAGYDIDPIAPQEPWVKIYVYDISDRENPELEKEFSTEGNYYTARMIDNYIYIISNKYVNAENPILPTFKSGDVERKIAASEIYYPESYSPSFTFTSVIAINVNDLDYNGNVFLTGYSSTIYVSKDNIYLSNQKPYYGQELQEDVIKEVFLKVLPNSVANDIKEILDSGKEDYLKQQEMNGIFENYFNSLTEQEKKSLQEDIQKSTEEFYAGITKKYEKTTIHKITIDKLEIKYKGSGEVSGYLLNQFSLDENSGFLRLATTTGNLWIGGGRAETLNHIYILNEDLKIIGSVEDIAKGERIFSARFVGDKAYMVTFRQVDPLFVIDVKNPENPKVLGYLKVTGFSNYLQPYDEDHLIGIGKEATEEGRQQGVKVSLFDVSDFENPKEVDKYLVEGTWSQSEAEYEHKAVLFDKEKGVLVIPVNYYEEQIGPYQYWQGAFVFNINKNSISLKGKISHAEEIGEKGEKQFYGYGYGQGYVKRSLFMDNYLYTISDRKIKANNLQTLEDIKSVNLPQAASPPIYVVDIFPER